MATNPDKVYGTSGNMPLRGSGSARVIPIAGMGARMDVCRGGTDILAGLSRTGNYVKFNQQEDRRGRFRKVKRAIQIYHVSVLGAVCILGGYMIISWLV